MTMNLFYFGYAFFSFFGYFTFKAYLRFAKTGTPVF